MPSTFLSLEFVELIQFEVDGAEAVSAVTFNWHGLSATEQWLKIQPTFIVFCGRFCSSDNSSVHSTAPSRFLFEVHGAGRGESSVKTILSRTTIGPSECSENEIQGELLEVGVGETTEFWVVAVRDG